MVGVRSNFPISGFIKTLQSDHKLYIDQFLENFKLIIKDR